MSKSLTARIERLEQAAGIGRGSDPLYVILAVLDADNGRPAPMKPVSGYSWDGGKCLRKPGESDDQLISRAEREALPFIQPWGGIVLEEMRP